MERIYDVVRELSEVPWATVSGVVRSMPDYDGFEAMAEKGEVEPHYSDDDSDM